MGRVIDALIAYRVLKLLVTPFNRTKAFKLGIIDDKGKVLIKSKDLPNSGPKREAYTLLIRFVFNLKRLLSKVGIHNYDLNSRDIYNIYSEGPIDGLFASLGYGIRTPIYKLSD